MRCSPSTMIGAFATLLAVAPVVVNAQVEPYPSVLNIECKGMMRICTSDTTAIPLNIEARGDSPDPAVCCDDSPSWFYFQLDSPGRIDIEIPFEGFYDDIGAESDLNYRLWGPFDTVALAKSSCDGGLTWSNLIHESCSTIKPERLELLDGEKGKIYVLLIRNCYQLASSMKFVQVSGDASTTCEPLAPAIQSASSPSGSPEELLEGLMFPHSNTPFPSVSPIDWEEWDAQRKRDERQQLRFESIVIIVVIVLIALLGAAGRFLLVRNSGSSTGRTTTTQQQEPETAPPSLHQDQNFLASQIAEMNVEELMVLFSDTFERNGRQTRLKACQILDGNPTEDDVASHTSEDDDDDEEIQRHNNENHPSIYLALESVRSILQSQRVNHNRNKSDADSDDDSVIQQKQRQQQVSSKISSHRLVHPGDRRKNVVGGHCVICLEDMSWGQMVVWSETKTCKHVYHKECLVSFLAHNKRQQVQLQRDPQQVPDHNPCPTCRQQFVTVCPTVPFQNNNANYTDTERASNQNANNVASNQNSNGWGFLSF